MAAEPAMTDELRPAQQEERDASTCFSRRADSTPCYHCGTACRGGSHRKDDKHFCCNGCLTVFELLCENGLTDYYRLNETAGVRVKSPSGEAQFRFLDEPAMLERLADFRDERIVRISFRVPAIHCIACVWLLENLFRLMPGLGPSQVDFPRKKLSLSFDPRQVNLSQIAALLVSLGYEPDLKLSDLDAPRSNPALKRLWMQIGVAGFAFGNNMLFSIALYLGVDAFSGPGFQKLVGFMSMALATPVLLYSARDYFRLAWTGLKHRLLTIEVPIAAGILVIYAQSAYEVIGGLGEGYFDSFAGLLFFLLCGRLFQQKTYERLAFDRDFKSFFPLSVRRLALDRSEQSVSLGSVRKGDRLRVRNGELIPADARLTEGAALIDYSFVTGESEPVEKGAGDYLYAGGRQMGGSIEVETVKPVSQSYLTSLWNQDAFKKETGESLDSLINRYSQRFTRIVIFIALAAAACWAWIDPSRSLKAFTSVLIVACPCALALAAPFTLGTAIRVLGRRNIFVKSAQVLERLARIDSVVFDKTGTLTAAGAGSIQFEGALSSEEERWIWSVTRHSTHPLAVRIGESIARDHFPAAVRSFLETAGCGMEASVEGREIWMGSAAWLASRGVAVPKIEASRGSAVHLAIDGHHRGVYLLASSLRKHSRELISALGRSHRLALLSGDTDRDRDRLQTVFGDRADLHFAQSPLDKLRHIERQQQEGRRVMMVGDGLNDAGALKQSDVGVAVVENAGGFSPASDIILCASMLPSLGSVLEFSRSAVRIVKISFLISTLYNVIGVGIAASGRLAPIVCAILMPLSSFTVVAFACLATVWSGRKHGLAPRATQEACP